MPSTQIVNSPSRRFLQPWLIAVIVIVVVIVGVAVSFIGRYNTMFRMQQQISQSWSQVDVDIQRRADLIPNLVATVKGIAKQEQTVIGEVTKARAALGGASTPSQTMAANNQMDGALSRLLVVVENYPNLKSSQNFLALQDELTGTENRIAVSRRQYNLSIQNYDSYIGTFPNNVVANFSGMTANNDYFKTSAANRAAPPTVSF